ncbi:polyketide synthase [Gloeobacter kilaueensis]|uniref:Polyketide biosynthesis enoyl-CoA hydratase n=1 Tax=Gloeobacter kilaueensis (strain ATCC BAA-2537 / CCAP 1431/1 / ULC 316 / JS1) TaxID=1183438 RepID=U5QGL4_GLOK1|nr:polyketide synthase [Gloeobacter kilaueensis]AGY58071.1 polyketide biosynthesis enoyl-CoA hydratase [Gloeobacter kilaueensis JS1]
MSDLLRISCLEEGIYRLQMDDPAAQNRLGHELAAQLCTALADLAQEPALRVLLLAGRADVFSAGGSLEVLEQLASRQMEERELFALPDRLLHFPMPVIAVLEGHAVGGGLVLALCCDLLVAASECRYGFNFTELGFTPGMGATTLLPLLVPSTLAAEMLLTARLFRGSELAARGLFNAVVPAAAVPDAALDLARRIALKPRHVLELLKETLALPRRQALQEAMVREQWMQRLCFNHPDTHRHIQENYLPASPPAQ